MSRASSTSARSPGLSRCGLDRCCIGANGSRTARIAGHEARVHRRRGGRHRPAGAGGRAAGAAAASYEPDFVVVNGENVARAASASTSKIARDWLDGDGRRDHARQPRLQAARRLRVPRPRAAHRAPANYPKGNPGRGVTVVEADGRAARRGQPVRAPCSSTPPARRSARPTRSWPSCAARPTGSSWTSTRRPRARRWRWAGTSTAA